MKLVHGVGLNDAPYSVTTHKNGIRFRCPFYERWYAMLRRCYSLSSLEKRPTYRGVTVCDEWLSFMSFKKWMLTQEWEGKELDKDMLNPLSNVYSPSTCCFITKAKNVSIRKKTELPLGIYKQRNRFVARINVDGKTKYLGSFINVNDAKEAYLKEVV